MRTVRKYPGLTPTEIARRLNVSPQAVRRWIRLGWLAGSGGGRQGVRIYVTERALERFLRIHDLVDQ